jgi:eukaryotic-like serine/threonine-protein kinase
MAFTSGTRLGPYEITALLGAGGMGEVYRATDTSLKRQVAIKVLPASLADDPERLARFQREAEMLAALNHPNIAHIHGVDHSAGVPALVMELVEGPTLADRIRRDAIPIDEALPIAKQIAEALEAAHEQGIIHRDLKPANIKVRADGVVKVLDFGLAKALAADADDLAIELSRSPTITTPAATRLGVVLGTAAYMSPEQARGQTVGEQTDIWAFGVMLYEMLTGRQAFTGETITDIIARIVTADPDWTALPESTPPFVRILLRQCLQKRRADRLHHIADARIHIDSAQSDPALVSTTVPQGHVVRPRPLAWIAAAALLITGALAALGIERLVRPAPSAIAAVRLSVPPPPKASFSGAPNTPYISMSPDGRHLAFLASVDGVLRVWVRSLDTLDARPLAGTEGVVPYPPFWSADSRFIGFFTVTRKLRKIELVGGPVQTICDVETGTINPSGAWNRDGVIVFGAGAAPLKRVSAAGGTPEPLTALDQSRQELGHYWPTFLPDGDHFFFLARSATPENSAIFIGSLSSRETMRVIGADSRIAYDPSGYLLFVRDGSLLALPFNARKLRPAGDPFLVAEHVRSNTTGQSTLTVSENGVLAYRTADVERNTLRWFDRSGKPLGTLGSIGAYQSPKLSPDEQRVAIARSDSPTEGADIWVIEVARGTMTRLTFGGGAAAGRSSAVWSPDGEKVAFRSSKGAGENVNVKAPSGAGNEEVLVKAPGILQDWSSDGRFVLTNDRVSIWVVPLFGDRKPYSYLAPAQFSRAQPQLSSDGRWMAYRSNESGKNEIYVQSFPDASVRARISTDGGDSPRWRRDGKEIFYLDPDQKLMVVSVSASAKKLDVSTPSRLFEVTVSSIAPQRQQYDVTSDGQRFLVNTNAAESETPVTVVVNWQEELKRRVATR